MQKSKFLTKSNAGARKRLLLVSVAMSAVIAGCGPIGLLFPYYVDEYYPEASSWGKSTSVGGCPSHTPALKVRAKNPDWLWIKVGIWDSEQTKRHNATEPTLFVHMSQAFQFSIEEQKRRNAAPLTVTWATPYAEIQLTDGSTKQVALERYETPDAWRWSTSGVPLRVIPQSLTVTMPALVINGEPVALGKVNFVYRKAKRYPC
jgi:hypothetical protein